VVARKVEGAVGSLTDVCASPKVADLDGASKAG